MSDHWVGIGYKSGETRVPLNFSGTPGHPETGAKQGPEVSSQATSGWGWGLHLGRNGWCWDSFSRVLPATRAWIREFSLGWGRVPSLPQALDLAGLASSGPGFRPPPPYVLLSPGQRKKPTSRPPPRARPAPEAPGSLRARPLGRAPEESPAGGPQPVRPPGLCTRVAMATPPGRPRG